MARADGRGRGKVNETVDAAGSPVEPSPQPTSGAPLGSLFNAITEAIAVWRPLFDRRGTLRNLVFENANEAFKRLFGISELESRKARRLSPSLDEGLPEIFEMCSLVAGSPAMMRRECYFPSLDKWLSVKIWCPTRDKALGAFEDITEQRLVAERLRRLEFSLDQTDDYPTWTDSEGRIIEISESTCRHLEYTREELLGMTLFDISPDTDREAWANSWKNLKPSQSIRMESRHRTKSGRFYPVELVITAMVFEGREWHCTYCRDISERRQLEQSLRLTQFSVDHAPDLVFWLDSTGRFVYVNEACCQLLGYSAETLRDAHIWDIDRSLNPESWPQIWTRVDVTETMAHNEVFTGNNGREHKMEASSAHVLYGGETYGITVARDVTERLRTEESLRLTQFAVDHAPDMVYWLDAGGRFTYANEAACRLLGYSLDELREMRVWDVSSHSTPREFKQTWRAAKAGGTILFEEAYRAKDGREFEVEVAAANFRHQGQEVGVAFVRDITEWKRSQQSLRDSEKRYRHLFELESDAIVLTEEGSGAVIEANEAACALYGYTKAELLGMRDDELFCEAEAHGSASDGLGDDLTLHWHRKKNGTAFPVEMRGRHFELGRQRVRVTAVRDISERRTIADELEESRRMLRQVLDTVPLRIAWRDRELRYLGCNLIAALGRGLPDPSAVVGLKDEELPVFNTNEQCRADDREVMESGTPKLQYEETALTSDGETRIMRSSKVPLRDRSGDVIGVLSVHEDITEQTAMRRALKEREEQLRQSQKMEAVGRLAGGIAHDFNNVLTTIIGYSDLILASADCPKGSIAEDVAEIKAAAERASGLTRRILAFSRRQALQPVVLSLNTVVADTERLLARTLGADIELRTSLGPDLGQVEIDEQQFVQVLLNLAVNARDAMPEGGVLTLETANVELDQRFCETHPDLKPGPHVMLSVTDTGTGMDADTMAHAFEPFYTTKPPGEGTGLGLSTVYGVVAQSGGCTYVRSEPGRGTTFTIYLPRVRIQTQARESSAGEAGGQDKGKMVLIVEDDATFLGLTVRILERRGYNVVTAKDGEQAIVMLGDPTVPVDALITDIVLPGHEQGDRVAAFASTSRPGLPVIFMSAHPRDRMIQEGKVGEQAVYLEKPFTAEELASRLRTSLEET